MKKILLCLLLPLGCIAQKKTMLIVGGSTNSGVTFGFVGDDGKFRLGASATIQINGQYPWVRSKRPSKGFNLLSGVGGNYSSVDAIIGYVNKSFTLQAEASYVFEKRFTNYYNKGVFPKKYHIIEDRFGVFGFGGSFGIPIHQVFEPFIGYHTSKLVTFGFRFKVSK